jgi:hypothetical protein
VRQLPQLGNRFVQWLVELQITVTDQHQRGSRCDGLGDRADRDRRVVGHRRAGTAARVAGGPRPRLTVVVHGELCSRHRVRGDQLLQVNTNE